VRVLTFALQSSRGFRSSRVWPCASGQKNPDVSTQRSALIFSDISSLEDAVITLSWKGGNLLLIDAGRVPEGRILSIVSVSSDGAIFLIMHCKIHIVVYSFYYVECMTLKYWWEDGVLDSRRMMCVYRTPNKFHPRTGHENQWGGEVQR